MLLLLLLVHGGGLGVVRAFELEAGGKVTYEMREPDGRRILGYQRLFRVFVRDCHWRIQTSPLPGVREASSRTRTHTVASDGENIYAVTEFDPEPGADRTAAETNGSTRRVLNRSATVEPGAVPVNDGNLIAPVWLALASSCHLSSVGASGAVPPFLTGLPEMQTNRQLDHQAEWRFRHEGGLLETFSSHDPGVYPLEPSAKERAIGRLPPPFESGYLSVTYRVEEFFQAGRIAFPRRSTIMVHAPRMTAREIPEVVIRAIFVVEVESASDRCSLERLTEIIEQPTAVVSDHRFQDSSGKGFLYVASNALPSADDPAMRRKLETRTARNERMAGEHDWRRRLTWALAMTVTLAAVVGLWKFWTRRPS